MKLGDEIGLACAVIDGGLGLWLWGGVAWSWWQGRFDRATERERVRDEARARAQARSRHSARV